VQAKRASREPAIDGTVDNRIPRQGWAAAFDLHAGRLRHVIAGMGFGPADSDDIMQDVMATAAERREELPPEDQIGRWLMRVTVNRCLLEFRRRKRFTKVILQLVRRHAEAGKSPQEPPEQAIRAEEFEMVRHSLRELDGPLLAAMVLTYYCGMNSTEVGEVLQVNPATVRSWLREARMKLAEGLLEKGFEP
jgi:RNA polymerase sigma factor (sigma-70 family)